MDFPLGSDNQETKDLIIFLISRQSWPQKYSSNLANWYCTSEPRSACIQKKNQLFVSWLSGPHGTSNFDHQFWSILTWFALIRSFGFCWRNNASILLKITCTSTATSSYEPCLDEYALKVGNGVCDDASNIESCNYDGGDCCGDTGMY